jgi:hypothetical protein
MRKLTVLLTALLLVVFVFGARADNGWIESFFDVVFEGDAQNWNELTGGGGDGWNGDGLGPWYSYPQEVALTDQYGNVENWPTFWNQWWYDHPYDPLRWKVVDLTFDYARTNPAMGFGDAYVVINYSTPEWSAVDPLDPQTLGLDPRTMAPMSDFGPNMEPWIGRITIDELGIEDDLIRNYSLVGIDLRDYGINYNPEWISVDVRGYNFSITN